MAGEINIANRLDDYESNLYELQFTQNIQSLFIQECMRILFTRTDMIIDMMKTRYQAPSNSDMIAKAKENIERVINKNVQGTLQYADTWKL